MNYNKHYEMLIAKCKNRKLPDTEYTETHHIIPRCLDGDNSDDNLVIMKPEEHFVAHQLLCKMHPGNHGLAKAVSAMCRSSSKNPRNNKWYSWIRKRYSASVAGENNHSAKFTNEQVLEIYHSCEHMDILAERYNVKRYNIITIKRKIFYSSVTKDIKVLPGYCPTDTGPGKTRPIPLDLIKEIYLDTGDYEHFLTTYGVSENVVKGIKQRRSFKKYTNDLGEPGQVKRHKLTNDMVAAIRSDTRPYTEIAEEYGMHYNTVRNIKGKYSRAFNIWDEF